MVLSLCLYYVILYVSHKWTELTVSLDTYVFFWCSSETTVKRFVCEMHVCNLYMYICVHLSVRASLMHLISMYGLAYKPLSQWYVTSVRKWKSFNFLCMFMLVLILALHWLTHCFLSLLVKVVRAISCVHKKINFRVPGVDLGGGAGGGGGPGGPPPPPPPR